MSNQPIGRKGLFRSKGNRCRQVADAHQVVSRGGEGKNPTHPVFASVPGLPEIPHHFYPAEDLFHQFAQALTDGVSQMAGGTAVQV